MIAVLNAHMNKINGKSMQTLTKLQHQTIAWLLTIFYFFQY